MLCFLLVIAPVCLTAIVRRRGARGPLLVPIAVLIIGGGAALFSGVALARGLEVVHEYYPADKATLLAAGISEGLNCEALVTVVLLPAVIVAYVVDRTLLRRVGRSAAPS